MGRRDKLNSMMPLFREVFEVRADGRVVYAGDYTISWMCVSGERSITHLKGETFGTNRQNGGHWHSGFHGVKGVKEHEVSWLLSHDSLPVLPLTIDHTDGNIDNNHSYNLRAISVSVNQHNQRRAKGYSWSKSQSKWQARIRLGDSLIVLGMYDTELDARAAYIRGKREFHPDCGWDIFQN